MALRITAAVAALLALAVAASWLHDSRTVQLFGELVASVPTADSVLALTFDDGPAAPHTDSILDLLQERDVRATFFVTGSALARYPAIGRRIVEDGHELGNHSYSHRRMVFRSPETIRHEVETTDSLIRLADFSGRIHFRPPYGKRLIGLPWYLARTGRATILWTLEPDSCYRSADEMVEHVVQHARPGSIILLHVEMRSRVEERRALPLMIQKLRERGYDFVTVSELVARSRS